MYDMQQKGVLMKILVTGSNGMLGEDLCPVLEDEGYEVIETTHKTMDVTNYELIEQIVKESKPETIIHLAAYTDTEKAETNREEAHRINIDGTKNIVKVCKKQNITLVFISTAEVFSGEKNKPYTVNDHPNPVNYYGKTKLAGEEYIQEELSKYYIIRTGWLYGHHGHNFVTQLLLKNPNDEIRVSDDEIGSPTWTVDLATGILSTFGKKYGIYHICNSGEVSRYEFAEEIFSVFNIKANLVKCKLDEINKVVKHPKYSVLDNNRAYRDWHIAFRDFAALADF